MKPIVVLNQEYEVIKKPSTTTKPEFPQKQIIDPVSHQSYATVLEQSLTTKDKQIIREIISYDNVQIINNTVPALPPASASQLLQQLEYALLEKPSQAEVFSLWMGCLLRQHLGTIINNPVNRERIGRIRKIIEKRMMQKPRLQKVLRKIEGKAHVVQERREYVPRFHYVEKEKEMGEEEMEEQLEQDEMLDEILDEDLDEYM